jgi:hypothetical protein
MALRHFFLRPPSFYAPRIDFIYRSTYREGITVLLEMDILLLFFFYIAFIMLVTRVATSSRSGASERRLSLGTLQLVCGDPRILQLEPQPNSASLIRRQFEELGADLSDPSLRWISAKSSANLFLFFLLNRENGRAGILVHKQGWRGVVGFEFERLSLTSCMNNGIRIQPTDVPGPVRALAGSLFQRLNELAIRSQPPPFLE